MLDCDTTILPCTIKGLSNSNMNEVITLPPKFTDELSLAELGMSGPSKN